MSVIGIVSMKGGVGKTSIAANLACALSRASAAQQVYALDLDPQDGLHWHLGLPESDAPGLCELAAQGLDVRGAERGSPHGPICLPFGDASEHERIQFETLLSQDPAWLGRTLAASGYCATNLVLLDTPPGSSFYLKQVFACADLVLVVLLADAGSYATIPAMETWLAEAKLARPHLQAHYLINQVDRGEALNRDTVAFLRQQLKPRMCPVAIHADESMAEALTFQQPVLAYEPHAQSSADLMRLGDWVLSTLRS
jgi:cellulose synthase operon protein YhjQ